MNRLGGKVVLITGASRGIGRAIALAMAREGARIAVTYRQNRDLAHQVVEAIAGSGGEALALPMEVRDRESVRDALRATTERFGGLDVLVNNAGVNRPTDFDQVTEEDWDLILAVNLKGPFLCCQEALPYLRRSRAGRVINIGSVSGQYGGPRTVHYAASKAGLIALGQLVARVAASDGITVNTIAAGLIQSEMAAQGLAAGAVSRAAEGILLGRLGTPEEVAAAAVFLASDDASYITAQTINVNGGLYF